jgi:uncharacterized protein YcnI
MTPQRRVAGACLALIAAAVTIPLTGTPAAAHVLLAKAQPTGDGTTTLTFTFDHGCEKSPTTELTVALPSGVTTVAGKATTQPDRWKARTTAKRVSWTGPGITPGKQATFSVVTRIIGNVGQTFHFPTLQRCDNGSSYQWDDHGPSDEHPAPTMIATRAVLASRPPPPALPAATTTNETGASLPQALVAMAAFTVAATGLGLFVARRDASGTTRGNTPGAAL